MSCTVQGASPPPASPHLSSSCRIGAVKLGSALSRSSRLYRAMVETSKALSCSVLDTFPGGKYPGMSVTYAVPSKGVDIQDCAREMRAQVRSLAGGTSPAIP